MKPHWKPVTFISLIMLLSIQKISGCSIFCEDGKIPCGGYGPTCEGFKGCTYPNECNTNSGQTNSGNSFSNGPSFNPRPTYPSGNNFNIPSNQGSNWNQINWQRPTNPDYQPPFNHRPNGQQSFNNRPNYQPPSDNYRPTFGNGIIA